MGGILASGKERALLSTDTMGLCQPCRAWGLLCSRIMEERVSGLSWLMTGASELQHPWQVQRLRGQPVALRVNCLASAYKPQHKTQTG